ncbi:MAG: 1-pyrroline-5-carboxylate dehydrogenase [Planctomycetales bacterium 4484_113]|nr:MAG: 1-pyrroline-5-carboxylate dehydrogenase [Planctomycetales bacterium 4484_113]
MRNGSPNVPTPINEPVKSYAPGTPERAALKEKLTELLSQQIEIPLIIGGEEVKTGDIGECRCPHDHQHLLATYHRAGEEHVEMAVAAAHEAWQEWSRMPWEARASVFLKAAQLLSGPWRMTLNAATMLGQSKNPFQAEIDSACELIDFWRFNPWYAQKIYEEQPPYSPTGMWNYVEQRPLEGFIFAVTPFNFTSIAGNLPTAPALMGNTVLWKPASSAVYPAYFLMKLLEAAGLPPGVINLVAGSGAKIGDGILRHPEFAGVHFTGSTATFQHMWEVIGKNIRGYHAYPRIVGETGGKDFVFAHPSADAEAVATALTRAAFEYQGQKCSAASRAYIPKSLWPKLKEVFFAQLESIKMGDVTDFSNFMNAVIDRASYDKIVSYIDYAKKSGDAEIAFGGGYSDEKGYFIEPTVILTKDPRFKTMAEEIFGPVLTIFVYDDEKYEETLHLCDETSPYALTGCIFADDRAAVNLAYDVLSHAAGNFYINDKPTAAVVGQQPFGGSRASGTNDKAGSPLNLLRWVTQRAIKETFDPPRDYRYPFMEQD